LAADIWFALGGKGIGSFRDPSYLTAFADYKVPQILCNKGILQYSRELEGKIRRRELLKAGSEEEIEIRSATIWAVEYIKEELEKHGRKLFSCEIDWILWEKSQKLINVLPHHYTKTIYY